MALAQFIKRFLSIGGSVGSQPARKQPIPDVTSIDVERIVERDFKYEFTTVMDILKELGTARVQLAALKLANGSVEKLRSNIESAKRDYRDILGHAEYPAYMKKGFGELPADERLRIIDDDWRQYNEWLKK